MQHLPLYADLKNRPCLVVGGGTVAEKRVRQLLDAGARVTVLAPTLSGGVAELVAGTRVRFEPGTFDPRSLDPYWLIVAATDDRVVNLQVAAAAEAAKRFCNVVDDPEHCTFLMPAIIDFDPVTIAVGTAGQSPVIARWLKGLIETVVPARVGTLAELAGRWRERVQSAIPAIGERRRFWEDALTGDVAEHAYAGRDEQAEQALAAALEQWRNADAKAARTGEAYLVGAGPGSPDLITVRGRQLLAHADVVLYDRLVNPAILGFARRDAELVCVGKTPHKPSITQAQLNRLLVQLVASGKRVCRLKGGDPMIFGRVGEELEALTAAGLPFQIVPGVSAVEGCAAYAGIPLTLRGVAHAILITTGHTRDHVSPDLAAYQPGQTLALYMGVERFASIVDQLLDNGHDPATPVAIVESGTMPEQRVIRAALGDLARVAVEHKVASPALLLVGETVRHAERYAWFNRNVLVAPSEVDAIKRKRQI
jgi:uroporphyrin-III C-methyltransferase / precorrin-2 dehydrogenase / sirohydrochlorin ferrochelatase